MVLLSMKNPGSKFPLSSMKKAFRSRERNERLFLSSGGSVAQPFRPRECHFGGALLMKALFAALTTVFFRLPALQTSLQPLNEKSPARMRKAFSSRLYE